MEHSLKMKSHKNHSNESFLLISLERKKSQENVFASLVTSPQKINSFQLFWVLYQTEKFCHTVSCHLLFLSSTT